jgi:hypothetical protein
LRELTLRSNYNNEFDRRPLRKVIQDIVHELKPLKKIDLSYSKLCTDCLILCLLNDIEKIVFKGNKVLMTCDNYLDYYNEFNKAIDISPVRKLYLDQCKIDFNTMTLIQRSKVIEHLSLKNIKFIGNRYFDSIAGLISNGKFKICDLRFNNIFINDKDIQTSAIEKIIISSNNNSIKSSGLNSKIIITANKQSSYSSFGVNYNLSNCITPDVLKNTLLVKGKPLSSKYGILSEYPVVTFIDLRGYQVPDSEVENTFTNPRSRQLQHLKDVKKKAKRNIINVRSHERINNLRKFKEIYHPIRVMHIIFPIKRRRIVNSLPDFRIVITGNCNRKEEEKEEILCHKEILSRSIVFKLMFSVPMKESVQGIMITDNQYYIDFIRYLYTGEISIDTENAYHLLDIARMHLDKRLTNRIRLFIYKNIECDDSFEY